MDFWVITKAASGTPAWHAARAGKIGGSAAVNIMCGDDPELSTFGTPITEWLRLTGRRVESLEDNAVLKFGRKTEQAHREWLEEDTGGITAGAPGVLGHDSIPWIAICPDGAIRGDKNPEILPCLPHVMELKAPLPKTLKKWKDGTPVTHQVQAALYMFVLDVDQALVSALSQTQGPLWSIVKRDKAFEQFMLDVLGAFMDVNVAKDIPPKVTGKSGERQAVMRSHPKDNGKSIDLPDELEPVFVDLEHWQAAHKKAETEVERLKTKIALAVAPNTEGVCRGFRATYKWIHKNAYPVKATDYPELRCTRI